MNTGIVLRRSTLASDGPSRILLYNIIHITNLFCIVRSRVAFMTGRYPHKLGLQVGLLSLLSRLKVVIMI